MVVRHELRELPLPDAGALFAAKRFKGFRVPQGMVPGPCGPFDLSVFRPERHEQGEVVEPVRLVGAEGVEGGRIDGRFSGLEPLEGPLQEQRFDAAGRIEIRRASGRRRGLPGAQQERFHRNPAFFDGIQHVSLVRIARIARIARIVWSARIVQGAWSEDVAAGFRVQQTVFRHQVRAGEDRVQGKRGGAGIGRISQARRAERQHLPDAQAGFRQKIRKTVRFRPQIARPVRSRKRGNVQQYAAGARQGEGATRRGCIRLDADGKRVPATVGLKRRHGQRMRDS